MVPCTYMPPPEISATQFRANCMKLLDEVERTGQPLVITKHGKPVARLESERKRRDLKGSVTFHVSDEELVYASMGEWDMERD